MSARFEVFAASVAEDTSVSDVTLHRLAISSRRLEGSYRLHQRGQIVHEN